MKKYLVTATIRFELFARDEDDAIGKGFKRDLNGEEDILWDAEMVEMHS